jgi:hypothetical protein
LPRQQIDKAQLELPAAQPDQGLHGLTSHMFT